MERENPLKFMACAAAALVAGIAFSSVTDDFESGLPSGWNGGSVVSGQATSPCGYAFSATAHANVLSVSGEATRSNSATAAAQAQADFLVNITEASDSDTIASPLTDVQIAIAADDELLENNTKVNLMINCKPKSGSGLGDVMWITGPAVTVGAWHRISLVFDYASGLCKVSVDGVPYVSTQGFLKATTTDENIENYTSQAGAWYGLAKTMETTASIESLTFVGVASVDDVLISETVSETFGGSGATVGGIDVDYAQLNKWGVNSTTIETAKLDNSGMTVAQKVVAGLVDGTSMTDGTKFEAKAMKMTAAGTATISLPAGIVMTDRTYTVKYKVNGGPETTVAAANVEADTGARTLTVSNLPDATVLTFTITASGSAN